MNENLMVQEQSRIIWMDYLRVFATLSVVILHMSCQKWDVVDIKSSEWNIFVFYDSMTRWTVPVFVMISGALLLPKDIPVKKLFSKYISRLAVSFFVWSALYSAAYQFAKMIFESSTLSLKTIVLESISGLLHLWFIPMMIGLYMCIPIIRQLIKSESSTVYYLSLSFVFVILVPQIIKIANDFFGGPTAELLNAFKNLVSNMNMSFVLGYAFYFVLGYILWKTDISKKQRTVTYILGIIGFLATYILTLLASQKSGMVNDYFNNFSINVFLESISVFIWFKYNVRGIARMDTVIGTLSRCSFGVYLIHVFVRDALSVIGINALTFSPIFSIPLLSIIIFVISFAFSYIINEIPILNKWIV